MIVGVMLIGAAALYAATTELLWLEPMIKSWVALIEAGLAHLAHLI